MMEAAKVINVQGKPDLWLPPGFRFHPTDDELISFYLTGKVRNSNFAAHAISEVDLNKFEPWDLPEKANLGEKEWYFFTLRDRKYPTGMRTNRATVAGYWKATGKDRDVISSRTSLLVGMKKTLVFYRGRAPRGEKTNWIMHEYRLEGKAGALNSLKTSKEWVVCRIFQKKTGAKKHATVQTDKDVSYSGASDPPSPLATRQSPLMGTEDTDDEDWCNNDQVSCVTKQQESEDLEIKRYLSGNNCCCKGKSTNFHIPSEDPLHSIGSFLKIFPGEEVVGSGIMSTRRKLTNTDQEFIPPLCSPPPYSSGFTTASRHGIDSYTSTNSNLMKSCKPEPFHDPEDDSFPSYRMAEQLISSWMGETIGVDNAGMRLPPPLLQLPPSIESVLETDSHSTDGNLSNLHRFLRFHPDPSLGLDQLYHNL